jgi:hypothetical protein
MGNMRKSNFQHSARSCSKLGRCWVEPSRGTGVAASLEDESDAVIKRSFFASEGSALVDMVQLGILGMKVSLIRLFVLGRRVLASGYGPPDAWKRSLRKCALEALSSQIGLYVQSH